jgi:hypothetical protein
MRRVRHARPQGLGKVLHQSNTHPPRELSGSVLHCSDANVVCRACPGAPGWHLLCTLAPVLPGPLTRKHLSTQEVKVPCGAEQMQVIVRILLRHNTAQASDKEKQTFIDTSNGRLSPKTENPLKAAPPCPRNGLVPMSHGLDT